MNHDYYPVTLRGQDSWMDLLGPQIYPEFSFENNGTHQNIKSIFDSRLANLTLDKDFFKEVHHYVEEFKHRDENNINFFGSNLTGVYPVRFKTTDRHAWLIDILNIDELETRREVIMLPTVDANWVRGTDVMNLSCLYLVHRITTNKSLADKDKFNAAMDVLLALHFKLIGSLMAHYFKFPADERLAQMTYARLSKKYMIKQYGSWYRVLEERCKDILSRTSIHARTIERFDDDSGIQNMITDIQGRLKAMIKKIWEVFDQVRNSDSKLMSTSGSIELEGKMVMRDLQRKDAPFLRYIEEIAPDKIRFIKSDLIEVIAEVMPTMPEEFLADALNSVSERAAKQDQLVINLNKEILLHAFEYFNRDRYAANKLNDIKTLLIKFRGLYMASRNKEERLLKMKDDAEEIVRKSIKSKNNTVIASVRTGLLLYVLLRTFTMDHYESNAGDATRVT